MPAAGAGSGGKPSRFGAWLPAGFGPEASAGLTRFFAAGGRAVLLFDLDLIVDAFFDEEGARGAAVVLEATLGAAGVPIFASRGAPALGFFGDDMAAHSAGTDGLWSSHAVPAGFGDLCAVG